MPTADELRALYVDERFTIVQIGNRFGWRPTKARKQLLLAGITLRRPGTNKRSAKAMTIDPQPLNIEWIRDRYCDDGWSLRDLADEFGRSKTHMRDVLARAGIEIRAHEREIDSEDLAARYRSGASLNELGREHQISAAMIRRRLLAAGVEMQSRRRRIVFPVLEDRTWLAERYIDRTMSMVEIAREVGCAEETVRKALVRHGIERRTLSDARRAQHARRRTAT